MSIKQYSFEGVAAGTSATTANTGATTINKNGGTSTFSTAAASTGTCGLEFVTTATAQYNIARLPANASNSKMAFSGVFSYLGSGTGNAPTATAVIGALSNNTDKMVQIYLTAGNQLAIYDSAASVATPRPTLTPGTKYRIEIVADGAAGSVAANLYAASGTTPIATWTKTSGANFGTPTEFNGTELGMISSNQAMTIRWDDIQLNDGSTTEIGPYTQQAASLVPSVTLSPTSGPVPNSGGTNGTSVLAQITTTGGNANAKTYAVRIEFSANGNFTDTSVYLDTTNSYQSSASFTFTPGNVGSYRVTPYVQQAA